VKEIRNLAHAGSNSYTSVFRSPGATGKLLDAADVRRDFRNAIKDAKGVDPRERTPRELRHSFVSPLSDNGIPLEEISRLVGHSSTAVTEAVHRKQIRPLLQGGATAMDRIFQAE
jgi:integrase